jgi:hypothetical protein
VIRIAPAAFVAPVAFAASLVLSRPVVGAGLVSDDAVTLWACAITMGNGV